jgi:predicted Zn-dependent protease
LGNSQEANEELERITPSLRAHPDVLEVRWQIYAQAKKWEACVDIAEAIVQQAPQRALGWIHRSFALHELERTKEARDFLLPAVQEFPKEWIIWYNLACYASQLGSLREARTSL